ncbi:hypothetical protein FA95DRAFT_1553360 [Auriscalpium vulgare]|uniref:Uncharacterized protein n=1 Tax=Auriscalpium vulgare TaxID=40419 RepID=A0ACB8S941_9AGAM|nr:hypothetical protein FA95DRAFT_1553360 [Auriscalpium vulgare]
MVLQALPSDILILIVHDLDVKDLISLSETCRILHTLVQDFGWPNNLRRNPRFSHSTHHVLSSWSPLAQTKYHMQADRAWAQNKFAARPLSRPWHGRLQPLLAINASRLVVAAGHIIFSYIFATSGSEGYAPAMRFECSYDLNGGVATRRDVTSLSFAPDRGSDRTLYVGFEHGALERIVLPPPARFGQTDIHIAHSLRTPHYYHDGELIEATAIVGDLLLSLSSGGTAGVLNIHSSTPTPHMIELENRGWSAFLSPNPSNPYAALGTSSDTPLAIYPITHAHFSPIPSAVLTSSRLDADDAAQAASAVYGISGVPPAFPLGASDQILVSGWYDGFVHVHDLRSSARWGRAGAPAPRLRPVLSLADPWSFEPIYTVSCGGGTASHIAAGSARHSVVAFWDVRSSNGWSVHAPGNDSSPVYSVILEGSRLFGATQSRPFVYDFGPGVTPDTYPPLPRSHGDDGLPYKKGYDNIGFYVTKYSHPTASVY